MKTIFNYLFAAWLIFIVFGCGKEEGTIVESGATGEYSALILSGKASPWTMGSGVDLKVADEAGSGYILASGKISGEGSFSLSVPAPDKAALKPISALSETGLSISDPSAKYFIASPALYLGGELFGGLEWTSELNGASVSARYCKAVYFFSDKDVTVTGPSYGFTARAGWNTLYLYRDGSANFYYSDSADEEGGFTAYGIVRE